jgi:SAM-dependent methyltransferase
LGGARRAVADRLRRTPLHPQWLLGPRRAPEGVAAVAGLVLDIGAADRWISAHLHPRARYLAIDYPTTAVHRYGTKPDAYADAAALPIPSASVDAVVCLETLEHVAAFERALGEIARVLKPGGRAFLSMPFLYPIHDAPHDHTRLTEHGWRLHLARAGLEPVRIEPRGAALDAAGVGACLALAAPLAARPWWSAAALALVAVPLIVLVNLATLLVRSVWPGWRAQCLGYAVEAVRP